MAPKLEVVFSGIDKVTAPLNKIANEVEQTNKRIKKAFEFTATAAGAYAAVQGVFALGRQALQTADEVQKAADKIGLSTDSLQELSYIAKQSGTNLSTVDTAFTEMSKKAYEAATGNKTASAAFKTLGVSVTDTNGNLKSNEQISRQVLDKLADLKTKNEQTALATQLFGKAGKEMVPILANGSEGIAKMRQEAHELGLVLSAETIAKLDKTGDTLDTVKTRLNVCSAEMTVNLAPAIETVSKGFMNFIGWLEKSSNALGNWWSGGSKAGFEAESEAAKIATRGTVEALDELLHKRDEYKKQSDQLATEQEAILRKRNDLEKNRKSAADTINLHKVNDQYEAANKRFADSIAQMNAYSAAYEKLNQKLNAATNTGDGKGGKNFIGTNSDDKKDDEKKALEKQAKEREKYLEDRAKSALEYENTIAKIRQTLRNTALSQMKDGYEKERQVLINALQDEHDAIINADIAKGKSRLEATKDNYEALMLLNENFNKQVSGLDKKYNDIKKKNEADYSKFNADSLKRTTKQTDSEFDKRREAANDFYKAFVVASKNAGKTTTNAEKAYSDELKAISSDERKYKTQQITEGAQYTLTTLSNTLQSAAQKNKEYANLYKTAAIATTIIDTYSGAQKAFNSLANIPYVGYALGVIAAGATVAAGLMRVNEIRKQQFVSGTTNAPGGFALVGEQGPELRYIPEGSQIVNHHKTNQIINNMNRGGTNLNVTIHNGNGRVVDNFRRSIRNGTDTLALNAVKKYILQGVV